MTLDDLLQDFGAIPPRGSPSSSSFALPPASAASSATSLARSDGDKKVRNSDRYMLGAGNYNQRDAAANNALTDSDSVDSADEEDDVISLASTSTYSGWVPKCVENEQKNAAAEAKPK